MKGEIEMKNIESHVEIVNGKKTHLAHNEYKEDFQCPDCGGDLITSCGPGISITFCRKCGWEEEDYDF